MIVAKGCGALTQKASRLWGSGHKTGNRDRCHVHAPSTCCASCGLSNCVVRYRRVDRPCRIHAYKVVIGRRAASTICERPYNSRHGFRFLQGLVAFCGAVSLSGAAPCASVAIGALAKLTPYLRTPRPPPPPTSSSKRNRRRPDPHSARGAALGWASRARKTHKEKEGAPLALHRE